MRPIHAASRRFAAALTVLATLLAAPATAQSPIEALSEEHDTTPPEGGNPALDARMHLMAGTREVKKGEKLAERARRESAAAAREEAAGKSRAAFEAAVTELVAAVRLQPDLGEAYVALGEALRHLGRPKDAAEVHYAALAKLPRDVDNLRGWARSMLALDLLGDTTQTYDRLRESFPPGAAVVMEEMKAWLVQRRAAPGDLAPADVERLATWIAEREGKAG